MRSVGDTQILETYLNSASKNTLETDFFPHGTNSLLTSVVQYMPKKKKKPKRQTFHVVPYIFCKGD
jgi:hypothetical protein